MDKETQNPMYPTEILSMSFRFSGKALQWLHGTTTDDDGNEVGNFTLLCNLLSRMALASCEGNGFRRPLVLSAGQAQYSEKQLSSRWNMGRKRVRNLLATLTDLGLIDTHRSRVASLMTFPCLLQWETTDGGTISNPFYHERRERTRGG